MSENERDQRDLLILAMHENGWSQREIAAEVGMSQRGVCNVIRNCLNG